MASSTKLVCLVLMVMAVTAPLTVALTCGDVATKLRPCMGYLQKGGAVPPGCCGGVKALNSAARTTADRQAACNCLKGFMNTGINIGNAASLPGKCGVNIPYKISPSTNCKSIK